MAQITYSNKVALNVNPNIDDINKVTDDDMNEIKNVVNENTPAGLINVYAGTTAPTGWLICDGSEISRTTYSDLFDVIGTIYGNGDGSTTFNLPNLKGKIPVGLDSSDTSFNTAGKTGGEKTHKLTVNELPTYNLYDAYKSGATGSYANLATGGGKGYTVSSGDQAHNNLQPYIVMNYIISY